MRGQAGGGSSENIEMPEQPKSKRRDPYAEMPIRALGYTNELGEAIRPLSPMLANLSWLPAIGYISADIADKYKQDSYANQDPSKGRASKQLVMQLLASVFLPTAAVKAGQAIVNNSASFSKKGLSLSNREKISDVVINSMKSGEHKNYLDAEGKVNKDAYKEALSGKFDEILKHRKTHNTNNPLKKAMNFVSNLLTKKPTTEKVKQYSDMIVDRLVDERQKLLDGVKPEHLSKRAFKKFQKASKGAAASERQSLAFDAVRKMEKGRMFNNRILKSIGGLLALSVMAKPIDNFVENYIVDKCVGPAIDKVGTAYHERKDKRIKTAAEKTVEEA